MITFKWTSESINRSLRQFFEQSDFEDCSDNRETLRQKINLDFNGDFSHKNLLAAASVLKLTPKKLGFKPGPRQAIISTPEEIRRVLDVVRQEFPWLAESEENKMILFDWLWRYNAAGGFTVENVRTAIQALGRSALEMVSAPAPIVVATPEPLPPPIIFDWSSITDSQEIPLTAPDGSPAPQWRLERATRPQIASFVRRQQSAANPTVVRELNPGQLPIDATQEQMKAATPSQLRDLVRRQQAARYSR